MLQVWLFVFYFWRIKNRDDSSTPVLLVLVLGCWAHAAPKGLKPLSQVQLASCPECARAVLLPGHSCMRSSPGQYWPRGQGWQRPEGPFHLPRVHTHALAAATPASEVAPALHASGAPPALYPGQKEPAAHGAQGPPGGPE